MSARNVVSDENIHTWLQNALENELVQDINFLICDRNKPGDGYVSDIVYIDVDATKYNGEPCQYRLATKVSKEQKGIFKDFVEGSNLFQREACIYTKLVPKYQKLLLAHQLHPIDFMPKCYWTKTGDDYDVLVFDNLKKAGYRLHQSDIPMDDRHIKLVLRAYARWHALSFALREHHGEEFKAVVDELAGYEKKIENKPINMEKFKEVFGKIFDERYQILETHGEHELLERYKEKMKDRVPGKWNESAPCEEECVITHGDCWNNNFLFFYEENLIPSKVCLLDFQISKLHSPARDISYFIYSTCSETELKRFKEYIQFYYGAFARDLKALGCDPELLFPFSKLVDHWRQYSFDGFQTGVGILKLCLSDDKGVGDDGSVDSFDWKIEKNKHQYEARLIACIRHCVEYQLE
ncbi:uncharacterized protein LOC132706280 [Cylas formicarius]|uniref:uncharacterized protein LOC132706280 n=1 Tax=Cylas formicarius TaxID=197179 RepID=UPI00295893D7|nr:uncharacterized protein LOC132706280 [Cylas formicarius]